MADPPPDTSTLTAAFTLAYSSAHACATFTIVSDPALRITADTFDKRRLHPQGKAAVPQGKTAANKVLRAMCIQSEASTGV
ncbi:MAG: hypothetical protein OHK0021_19600 [Bryobacter sp.]